MSIVSIRRSMRSKRTSVDLSWRELYRVGSIAAALYVVLIIVPVILVISVPQPPLAGGAATLQYIATHKFVYILEFISFVGLSLPAIIVFLALAVALKHVNKSYVAIGAIVAIVSEVMALAYNSSPPSLNGALLPLSDHYIAAATEAQRVVYATAAEGLIAMTNQVNGAGILTAAGILILSLVMLNGVFHKGIAYLGIITGALGIVSEALRDIIGPGYFVYGLLLPAWFLVVGWRLYQLGASSSQAGAREKEALL